MTVELYLAGIILAALVLYALFGGADFGAGVWDLLATGPRARQQREVAAHALGPIWEANHIWLIAVIVLLFSCFPPAYATIATALHVPLTVMLFGICLRGAAYVFRKYDTQRDEVFDAWSRLFALSSVLTPFMLGVCLGAAASGRIRRDPLTASLLPGSMTAWLAPFPLLVGAFVVVVFAFLAAVYLTVETDDPDLQDDFRVRALGAAGGVTALAWAVFFAAETGAPVLRAGLWSSWWAPPFQIATAGLGAAVLHALWTRRYVRARVLSATQTAAVICGFGAAQYPFLVTPDITFQGASSPPEVLNTVAVGMTIGLILLTPAYVWLFWVFKSSPAKSASAP